MPTAVCFMWSQTVIKLSVPTRLGPFFKSKNPPSPKKSLCLILFSALPYLTSTSINDGGGVERGVVAVFDRLGTGSDWASARRQEGKSRSVPSAARTVRRSTIIEDNASPSAKLKSPQRRENRFRLQSLGWFDVYCPGWWMCLTLEGCFHIYLLKEINP